MSAKLLGMVLHSSMPTTGKLVLMGLCDAAEGDGSSAYPSVARLANAAGCRERAAQSWLKRFRETTFKGGRRLIHVVRQGGGGPGSMTEYKIDVELLVELEAKGWDALIEAGQAPIADADDQADGAPPCAKGAFKTPLEKGAFEPEKGAPGGEKGAPANAPDPSLDPSFRPGESAGARGRQQEAEPEPSPIGKPTPEETLAAFRKLLGPTFALEAQGPALSALCKLSAIERQAAVDRYPDFLAFHRENRGSRPPPPLCVYLAERRWIDVPSGKAMAASAPAAAAAGASGYAAAFSRTWWAIFHAYVASSLAKDPEAFKDRDKPWSQGLRKQVSLATSLAIGWKLTPEQIAKFETEGERLTKAPADGDTATRWRSYYSGLGVIMPTPDKVEWIWLPAEAPEAVTSGGIH